MPDLITTIQHQFRQLKDSEKAQQQQRFFKTAPGENGHGDCFPGITVPQIRRFAKQNKQLSLDRVQSLLYSRYHEERFPALVLLIQHYHIRKYKQRVYALYREHRQQVNNWDLVDVSAHKIDGDYLLLFSKTQRRVLYTLAQSKSLWEHRIAVIAIYRFIQAGQFTDTLQLTEQFLHDPEDVIHKAVGWMLREIGKRDDDQLQSLLCRRYHNMPRTMLRYAIEKLPHTLRRQYLDGTISN
ncbi:MAG: DNA alkylation repair protein [Gammaproteobacteria bacterium]|nr:DNA alkylation repair protein [Gammaproteobacteria bacterium]MDH5799884.1 DNA alkylation repair protein [Gammaproteobacteria bacterium]